jgi:hypothetical protein
MVTGGRGMAHVKFPADVTRQDLGVSCSCTVSSTVQRAVK